MNLGAFLHLNPQGNIVIVGNPSASALRLIRKLLEFDNNCPGCLEPEFLDWLEVIAMGARKYAPGNWLKPDGTRASRKAMHDSITHHRAESYVGGPKARDKESGLHPNLHEICRSNMQYVRDIRRIVHPDDPVQEIEDIADFQESYNKGPNL